MSYRTFLRTARNFEEFAKAEKIEVEQNLTMQHAQEECRAYNKNRTSLEIEEGTKMEFEEE